MILSSHLQNVANAAFRKVFSSEHDIEGFLPAEIAQAGQPQFGHYQCNTPLRLGKALGINPREVATKIAHILERETDLFAKVEVAGPGFINLTLTVQFLEQNISSLLSDERLGMPLPEKKEKVLVEFSSPNVAKELHVGHLRSTIIGESLSRICEFLGHDVHRINHIGDWGTQFGMLIAYLEEEVQEPLEGATLSQLMQWYRASKQKFDADEVFRKKAHLRVVALQGGEKSANEAWEKICEVSRRGFEEIYDLLDVRIEERGESFYNPMLAPLVDELLAKKIAVISDGAACIFLDGFVGKEGQPLPMIIRKSDGGYNYDTTDLAALKHRIQDEKADRIIYTTDAGQRLHFEMLFAAAKKIGWYDPEKVRLDHVTFGVVLGSDGKKFKTRSGETEKLIDLLSGAIEHAETLIREKDPTLSNEEAHHIAKAVGINAVKYADLSCNRSKDYVFSYERMLRFEGNTAVFLMYAYVRIQGIKRKTGKKIDLHQKIRLTHPSEETLALHLLQFPEMLSHLERDLLPSRLCEYLYTLAEKFNAFFRDCRVEGSDEEMSRLALSECAARVLKQGMALLGMKTLEKM